jgi:hypothetical protein
VVVPLTGWGAGAWGTGAWGVGSASTDSLRIWSQSNFGEDLVFCPRGGGLYYWDASAGVTNNRGVNVTTLAGASDVPTKVNITYVSDISRFVFAFGCTDIGSSVINPMLIRWPGVVRPGSAMETPVSVEDLFPTIIDMAGIKNPKIIQTIDGKDLVPLLSGRTKDLGERSFFWHFPVKWTNQDGPAINFFSAVARGDWKLVVSLRTGKKELYNIRKDIGETQDLAAQHPDKVRELAVLLGERLKDMKTPMPGFKSTGLQVPYPHE